MLYMNISLFLNINIVEIIDIIESDLEIKKELTTHYNNFLRPILTSLNVPEDKINAFVEGQLKTSLKPWSRYFLQGSTTNVVELLN